MQMNATNIAKKKTDQPNASPSDAIWDPFRFG